MISLVHQKTPAAVASACSKYWRPKPSSIRRSNFKGYLHKSHAIFVLWGSDDFGERCFSHAGPKAWNALPAELQDLTDHSAFKRQLKTFLFECAFTT